MLSHNKKNSDIKQVFLHKLTFNLSFISEVIDRNHSLYECKKLSLAVYLSSCSISLTSEL